MNRKQERKNAFEIIFSFPFNSEKHIDDIVNDFFDADDKKDIKYIHETVYGVYNNLDDIDQKIKENLKERKFERLDNVCLAVMRLAVYEILYNDEIPLSVAINEAIELIKDYDDSLSAFVHGNLAKIANN